MYNYFAFQLSDTILMDENKNIKSSLTPSINNITSISLGHFITGTMKLK